MRRAALAMLLATSLSGCIGALGSLGVPGGDRAMRVAEIHALLGPAGRRHWSVKPTPPDHPLHAHRFVLVEIKGQDVPVRLFPFPEGIVVEVVPGAWGNPFWLYGAVLPHPDGGAFFMDEFQLVEARKGRGSAAARRAYPRLRGGLGHETLESGLEIVTPHDLRGVLDAYRALAAAGEAPMTVIQLDRSKS